MSKLTNALRVVAEPLRLLIARNSLRIDGLESAHSLVLPSAPTSSDAGKIPMVQKDGSWGLGEVVGSAGGGKDFIIDQLDENNAGNEVFSINCDFEELWSVAHGRDANCALKMHIRRTTTFEDGNADITWYGIERVSATTFERTPGVQESAERAVMVTYDDGSNLVIWSDNIVERYEF